LALAGSLLSLTSTAAADDTPAAAEAASAGAEAPSAQTPTEKTSVELRFVIFSPSGRWSVVDDEGRLEAFHAKQSLYFGPGLGVHVFIKQPHHGLIVDVQYKLDTDVDSKFSDSSKWRTDFFVARVGYGYRFLRHANEKMTWAFTPSASFSTGASLNRTSGGNYSNAGAVVGARLGINVDLHIERFFMGWYFAYEGLVNLSGGPLRSSQFLLWTLIPVFRIGVDLGPRIQSLKH
jgi:hypothetical protein